MALHVPPVLKRQAASCFLPSGRVGVGRSAAMAASVPASSVRSLTRVPSVNPTDSQALAVAVRKVEVPVANIKDGSVLTKLAEEHLRSLKRLVPSRPVGPEGDLTWGSICSRPEGPHFAFLALEAALAKNRLRCKFKHRFSSEILKQKQEWIRKVLGPHGKDSCCFNDVCTMSKPLAPCAVHGKDCAPRLWISWWSERVART